MNKSTVDKLLKDVTEALDSIATKYEMKRGRTSLSYDAADVKLSATLKGRTEEGETGEQLDYKQFGRIYGLKEEWLGQAILIGRTAYTVSGLLRNARKNNVLLSRVPDGKRFKTTHWQVRQQLNKTT